MKRIYKKLPVLFLYRKVRRGVHVGQLPGGGGLHQHQPVGVALDHHAAPFVPSEGGQLPKQVGGKEDRIAPLPLPGQRLP